MTVQQIIDYCWWYLDHLPLLLIPAAIFDILCWIAIAIYLNKRRETKRLQASPDADVPPPLVSPSASRSPAAVGTGHHTSAP